MPAPLSAILPPWPPSAPRPRVSVVILTLNECINIEAAIASCCWSDDVHVLDSGSTDGTQDLARAAGATVHIHPFESFGKQRNWAIDHIPLRHDWVFHLDADERFTVPLVGEMGRVLEGSPALDGFYVANQMIFQEAWIKHASGYPNYQMRLFHKTRMRFTDVGHGQREASAEKIGTLQHPYLHLNFSKGMEDWRLRHERYSTLEAREALAQRATPLGLGDLFKGGIARRRAAKRLATRMPFRPTLRFWHTLLVQRGILDGRAGWAYARLMARYESMIVRKIRAGGG